MHARPFDLALCLIFVLLATGCGKSATVSAADKPDNRPALEPRLKELIDDRVETARKYRDAEEAAFQADTVVLGDLVTATNDLLDAELAAADTPDKRIAAHQARVAYFRRLEQKFDALNKVGDRGGEVIRYETARFNRESAEIALIEACIAAARPYPTFDADLELPAKPGSLKP